MHDLQSPVVPHEINIIIPRSYRMLRVIIRMR